MTTRTLTFDLPGYYDSNDIDADRAPLAVLRAAIVVGEHVVDHRCHYSARNRELCETASLLRTRLKELLCFLDVYEQKLDAPPRKLDDDEIPF